MTIILGKLLRCYTQNIDGLERQVGISEDKLIEVNIKCWLLIEGISWQRAPVSKHQLKLYLGNRHFRHMARSKDFDVLFVKKRAIRTNAFKVVRMATQ